MWGVLCAVASTVGLRLLHPDWLPWPTGGHWRGKRRTVLQCVLSRPVDQYAAGSVSWCRRVRRRWVYSVWVIYNLYKSILYTVYALTFAGLNFCSFCGSAAIHESFILRKFRPVFQQVCSCKTIVSQKYKKWWQFARATWYAAKNHHQSNWLHQNSEGSEERRINESKTKTLHPQKYKHENC